MHVYPRTFTITLSYSLITPISPTILGELVLVAEITEVISSTRVPSSMPSLSSGQTSFRANRLRTGIYIIVVLDVSTTTCLAQFPL